MDSDAAWMHSVCFVLSHASVLFVFFFVILLVRLFVLLLVCMVRLSNDVRVLRPCRRLGRRRGVCAVVYCAVLCYNVRCWSGLVLPGLVLPGLI